MNNRAELATIISQFLPSFNTHHKLPAYKLRALDAIQKCRTEYMGGHIEACTKCGDIHEAFNSCRNRHCPKCGAIDKEKWIINREADLLPVKYFHVVFTVPHKLNSLFIRNQQALYHLLFATSWEVLSDFGKTKKWIGGKIGATAILHTTGQNLNYHPHIHFIVPAGALMPNGKWKNARNRGKYLFNVENMSTVFQARFVEQLRLLKQEKIINGWIPNGLFDQDWVVYAKQAFGGPKQVINYLGRYTHRTAISNDRILELDHEKVTFTWNDYHKGYKKQISSRKGEDFLGLFCQHILPPGFTRIRHYGFLSSASKRKSLAIIRNHLKVSSPSKSTSLTWQEIAFKKMGIQPGICKCCGAEMLIIQTFANRFRNNPQRAPPKKTKPERLSSCISDI